VIGTSVSLRVRLGAQNAHYGGDLIDGATILSLFGDAATQLLIALDGDEGLLRAYDSIEFVAPVFAGDFVEATAELLAIGNTSRRMRFEARKFIAGSRGRWPTEDSGTRSSSAADWLVQPITVAHATGTCVVPIHLQRKPRALYMPGLPAGPPPAAGPIVTPTGDAAGATASRYPSETSDVILTAAIVGAEVSRTQTPHVPFTPSEVADEAARCREAGAAVIHLHVRRDDGTNTQSAERFAVVIEALRQKCDCIVQVTTGGEVGMSVDERSGPLACRPEMATLNCGSINFGDHVFVNSRPDIRRLAAKMRAATVTPELECYEIGHIDEALRLFSEGLIAAPLHFQFVLGVKGGIPAREDVLLFMRSQLPAEASWGVAAMGRSQQPMTELAIRSGGHARVGLEDNIYLSKGVLSEGSSPLVARAAAYARSVGRQPADPALARRLLGLDPAPASRQG
jgi:3-keto-5-aminohexanoate cleavage enzyme